MAKKPVQNKKDSKKVTKTQDFMKTSPEDLYKWIEYAYEKIETSEGRVNIKNAWKGCGY